MKLLTTLFCVVTLVLYFFGHVTINHRETHDLNRIIMSVIGGIFVALVIGLPLLGILSLLGL